jgi:hypothetical protein
VDAAVGDHAIERRADCEIAFHVAQRGDSRRIGVKRCLSELHFVPRNSTGRPRGLDQSLNGLAARDKSSLSLSTLLKQLGGVETSNDLATANVASPIDSNVPDIATDTRVNVDADERRQFALQANNRVERLPDDDRRFAGGRFCGRRRCCRLSRRRCAATAAD